MTPDADVLTPVVRPVVESHGLDLEKLSVVHAGRRSRVVVAVDKDGGVSLDECADVARDLSARLDAAPEVGDAPYVLEVGSPGVDEPLAHPRRWRRNVGRLVQVRTAVEEPWTGRLVAADEAGADLDVDGQVRRVAYSEVSVARVQVELNPPDRDAGPDGQA